MTTSAFGKPSRSKDTARRALLVLCLSIASSVNAAQAASPKVEKALDQPSIRASDVEYASEPWARGVKRLLIESGVSGGIVEDERALEKRPEKRSAKDARLSGKEVLDRLTAQNAGYKWEAAGESLNVLPRDLDRGPLKVLNVRVKHFSTTARSATVAILTMLEEQKFPIHSEFKYMLGGIKPKNVPPKREFLCEDKTVLECMNQFASEDGSLFWHLYFHRRAKGYVISSSDEKEK